MDEICLENEFLKGLKTKSSLSNKNRSFTPYLFLEDLAMYNPEYFTYDKNQKICRMIKDIELSKIKISNDEFWDIYIFIKMKDGEKFIGNYHKLNIDLFGYQGFFIFEIFEIPNVYPEISNLNVYFGEKLDQYGGGIITYGGYYFKIKNCNAYGNINSYWSSGIIGAAGGHFEVNNCNFYGDLNNQYSAGIAGGYTAWYDEIVTIKNCKFIGKINADRYCGGICGYKSGIKGGSLYIINCQANCEIDEFSNCGAIIAPYCGDNGLIVAYNCNADKSIINNSISGRILGTRCCVGSDSKAYLLNCSEVPRMIGSFSNLNNIHISNIYKNKVISLRSLIYDGQIHEGRPVRLIRFEKINNAKYYLVKKYYDFWQKPCSIERLCGCEDLIIDYSYDLCVNKVKYIIEGYDCNNNKLGEHKFINCMYQKQILPPG